MAPYDNSLWFIETNVHPLLESAKTAPKMVNYLRPSFWSRFLELNSVMWATNAGLTERHAYDSRPQTWPVLRRGINFWTKDHRQIYLIGNPFIWWSALCAIMVYFGGRAFLMLRAKRGCKDFQDTMIVYYDQTMGFLALGWAMHFLPFFTMHRQLFIHHYLPALYFSILLLAVLFDLLTSGLRPKYRFLAAMIMILIAFASYSTYVPITYATPWTQKACERARLLKTWDLNCKDFPQDIKQYSTIRSPIHYKEGEEHLSSASSALGTITADVLQQANAAQAGNHPFEQAPQLAASSGVAEGAAAAAQSAGKQGDAGKDGPDKVQGEAAPPEPAAAVPAGTGEVPQGQAVLEAEEKQRQKQAQEAAQGQAPAHGVDPKALDAEALEGLVLSGTSLMDQSKSSAVAATTPSHAA